MFKALVFDIDGSVVPQGGAMDRSVSQVFFELSKLGFPMGPATGKNADFGRGLASGIGVVWDFIIAESGAAFLRTIRKGPPPTFEQRRLAETGDDLSIFKRLVELDDLAQRFKLYGQITENYRPELKSGILTLFPHGTAVDVTLPWLEFFQTVIDTFRLRLKLNRFSDGCIDVVPNAIAKHLGVEEVCKLYNCQTSEILTVVDGANDIELAEGTTPIAVSNAAPNIKELATRYDGYISTFPDGFGFCDGLLHFARKGMFADDVSETILSFVQQVFPELA